MYDVNIESTFKVGTVAFFSTACCSWMPSDYIDPCTPPSPSISMVHAYRDNELVNVPCNLLVRGDVVVLGPGHSAPAQVQQVDSVCLLDMLINIRNIIIGSCVSMYYRVMVHTGSLENMKEP